MRNPLELFWEYGMLICKKLHKILGETVRGERYIQSIDRIKLGDLIGIKPMVMVEKRSPVIVTKIF